MTGYVRQSAADIVPTAVVRAAPINNELNALRDAFAQSGGHKHDGTAAEGAYVPLISDTNAYNKVVVDSANNRISIFVNVSSAAVEQLRVVDGALLPVTDNDIDLGSSSLEFKDLWIDGTANIDSLVADTADINGGTIDNTVVGATTPAAATVTNLTVNSAATIASADINAGTIDGAVIGGSSAQAVTGTTITATVGFVGGLTGNVTGNTTGTHTGAVTGNVTGDVTGNVTASTGTSTFNDVVINGGLNMNAGTTATITNLTAPTNSGDAATKGYVDTSISNLIDSAPGTLDTLNELAAALGDDPSFATTVTNSIATKLPLAGGTMSGAIAMGTNKITGLGDPASNQDAATKKYVDDQAALKLSLSGGTMSGAIAMGTNKITGMGDPTSAQDAATKNYIDTLFGSTTSAAASAAAAATSASNAATSASNASTSASNAATSASAAASSATAAAASYDSFDDRYLGAKSSSPTVDNDGNTLITGALYFDTTANEMRVWTGSVWKATGSAVNGTSSRVTYTATSSQTTFAVTYDVGYVDVYLNGIKLLSGTDFTATSGTDIVLQTGATTGDIVDIVAYGAFVLANVLPLTGGVMSGSITFAAGQTFPSDVATLSGTQTLTNKTISVDNNTVGGVAASSFVLSDGSGNIDGAASQKAIPAGVVVGTTDEQTLTNKTFTGYTETVYALGTSGSQALNPANGTVQSCAAAGTVTFTDSLSSGQSLVLRLANGASYTINWPTITWVGPNGNTAPTLNAGNVLVFWKEGTTLYGAHVGKYA